MDENALGLLNQILKKMGFDPNKKTFDLAHESTQFHFELENVVRFVENVDHSGRFGLLYLNQVGRIYFNNVTITALEYFENLHVLDEFQGIWDLMSSGEMEKVKKDFRNVIVRFVSMASNGRLIGEDKSLDDDILESVMTVGKNFFKLHFESYRKSGSPIGPVERVSSKIHVFRSLGECVLSLEDSDDGLYICYITDPGLDGYFGFFVKSNGNLFSLNERIDEKYIGQHRNFRNGRHVEDKALDMFPYDEICKFSGEDYKGYPTGISIDEGKIDIFNTEKVDRKVCIRMILCIALIDMKYHGTAIEGQSVMINSLLPQNMKQIEGKSEALVKYQDSSIVKATSGFKVEFEKDKLLSGEYNKRFNQETRDDYRNPGKGHFPGFNQELVETYGQDFEFDNESLMKSDCSRRLIGEGSSEQEFVGTKERFELQAYYKLRWNLARHIESKMYDDYKSFTGEDPELFWNKRFNEWYISQVKTKIGMIEQYCVECYSRYLKDGKTKNTYGIGEAMKRRDVWNVVERTPVEVTIIHNEAFLVDILNDFDQNKKHYVCPVTGRKVSIFFKFSFIDSKAIEKFMQMELPRFCKGWTRNNETYSGNSILDVVDPVSEIRNPLERSHMDFSFKIGFSKSGLNQLLRERKNS